MQNQILKGVISILSFLMTVYLPAQDMLVPTRLSQRATISQRIGTTDITIVYHSPSANGRKMFGGVIPYDFLIDSVQYPWRAGSNENTTIEFSQDVTVEGKSLSKGKYGLHIYVEEHQWTYIFSSNAEKWGSFSYDINEDALRVTVPTESAPDQEWLSYNFMDREAGSAVVELHWTDVKSGFRVSVDVLKNAFSQRSEKVDKTATDYAYMADLVIKMDSSKIDEALSYIDKSIALEPTFQNKMIKARLLGQKNLQQESELLKEEALGEAQNFDWYYYALGFLFLEGNEKEAFHILTNQLKLEPDNYPVNLAMAEYFVKIGNREKATHYFKRAYETCGERSKNYTRYMYLSNKLILTNSVKN